jgi:hypothetical protein
MGAVIDEAVFALHVAEERQHQAFESLQRAKQALPLDSAAHAQIDAACAIVKRDWQAARRRVEAAYIQRGQDFVLWEQ